MATKNEKNALDKIARLGCIVCSAAYGIEMPDVQLHHVRRFGKPRFASPCLPLCFEHHLGNTGIHLMGAKGFTAKHGFTQEALLEKVNELLGIKT
jgi:hypothetical protein